MQIYVVHQYDVGGIDLCLNFAFKFDPTFLLIK